MSDNITIQVPVINAAGIAPNPVGMNVQFRLSVTVTDTAVILEPEIWYAGEVFAGEV